MATTETGQRSGVNRKTSGVQSHATAKKRLHVPIYQYECLSNFHIIQLIQSESKWTLTHVSWVSDCWMLNVLYFNNASQMQRKSRNRITQVILM